MIIIPYSAVYLIKKIPEDSVSEAERQKISKKQKHKTK